VVVVVAVLYCCGLLGTGGGAPVVTYVMVGGSSGACEREGVGVSRRATE